MWVSVNDAVAPHLPHPLPHSLMLIRHNLTAQLLFLPAPLQPPQCLHQLLRSNSTCSLTSALSLLCRPRRPAQGEDADSPVDQKPEVFGRGRRCVSVWFGPLPVILHSPCLIREHTPLSTVVSWGMLCLSSRIP